MRKLIFIMLLAATAVAGASTPKYLLEVPLHWKPPSSFKVENMAVPETAIEIAGFQDVRQNKEAIGENTEEKTPKPVTTAEDVGAFVSEHLREVLRGAGFKIVDSGGTVKIAGKVTRFFVEETSRYNSTVTVQLTVSAHGRLLWSGAVTGEASHFGRSYKLDNYYEGISDAIMNVAGSMLQNALLVKALRSPPPAPKHEDAPQPPAEPLAPADRTMMAQTQHSSPRRAAAARPAPATQRVAATPRAEPAAEALAQSPSPRAADAHVWVPEKRIALVVGNGAYGNPPTWPDLKDGPAKDAEALAARLRQLHFEVTLVRDADYAELNSRLDQFGARITPNTLALFYFAGHGAQAPVGPKGGTDNYLIPVGTDLIREGEAHFKAVSLSQVRENLNRARAAIVILDACRPNGLQRTGGSRAASIRGLAATESVPGMLVVYSAPPGEVVDSRSGQPSRYTRALLDQLNSPDQSLTALLSAVRNTAKVSGSGRAPELAGTLNDDVWLEPGTPH